MLGAQLGRCCRVQNFLDRDTFCANNALNFGTAEGKRARLVDQHHIDTPQRFEVDATLDDRA
jgi:hypothetical protein